MPAYQGENRGKADSGTPPVEHRFRPGQSGNPSGRPKGRSLAARLRTIIDRETKDGKDYGDLIMEVLVKAALKGDMKAMGYILDRVDGKLAQPIKQEISGPDGGPVEIRDDAPDLSKLSDAEFRKLERMSRKLDVVDVPRVGPRKHRRGSRKKKTK